MMTKKHILNRTLTSIVVLTILCGCSPTNKSIQNDSDSLSTKLLASSTNVFFSLPTPLETALMLKSLGIKININDLNSLNNEKNYLESKERALNLGIYSVDLCFASVNDQSQLTLNYAKVVNGLLTQLGISSNLTKDELDTLQLKIADKDYIKSFISDKVLKNLSDLNEDRKSIGFYCVMGGYIEGLYLLLSSAIKQPTLDQNIKQAIGDQKLVFDNIASFVAQLEKSEVKPLLVDIEKLKSKLDLIKRGDQASVQVYDSVQKVFVIKSKEKDKNIEISKSVLTELFKTVQSIRKSYTK